MSRRKRPITPPETEATLMFNLAVERYIAHETDAKRLSKVTLAAYRAALRRFARTLPANTTLIEITPQFIRHWLLGYCKTHEHGSVYQMVAALRSLSAYLRSEGWWLDDPCADLTLPKKKPTQPHILRDTEVHALLLACDRIAGEKYRSRARAVFSVLIYGALRRQEMLDLKIEDVELTSGKLTVRHGKGDKVRVVYLPTSAVQAIRDWLRIRPREAPHDYLFCANNRFRMGAGAIKRMFEQVWAIAGYPEPRGAWCHALRHAAATRLLRNGATLADIQAYLGHRHLQTTAIYLHTDDEQLRKLAGMVEFAPAQAAVEARPSIQEERRSRRVGLRRG